ncbi:MAG: ribonucleoside-triphosphate reductase, partial [Bacteroidales bacterium]|nr:ribonucleoside-triphosphate reductase [Bacteroidales bacterium]
MDVRKTNGSIEEYDKAKLARGIHEAYKTAGQYCDDAIVVSIINNLYIYDGIYSSEIRRQVVDSLMSINKKVALAYIEKFDADLDLRKKRDFIKDYIAATNAASGSKFDANANVTRKNIVTLGNELYKENNIKQNRYIMCDKIKTLYGRHLADQYLKDLESHVLYKHDESGTPGFPYCVAITMYPFLISGLKELGGVSVAPTDLKSFCGEFINLVYSVSSQFMGAVATPEFLMYFDYFVRKDYGDDYLEHLDDVVEINVKKRTLVKVIDNYFQQVVHSM